MEVSGDWRRRRCGRSWRSLLAFPEVPSTRANIQRRTRDPGTTQARQVLQEFCEWVLAISGNKEWHRKLSCRSLER